MTQPSLRALLEPLVAEVGGFYITDRAMKRAQQAMASCLGGDTEPDAASVRAYLAAVRDYFGGFEREARGHLHSVDRRLAKVSQLQFNLTAERGVATRRIAATQGVLARLAELADTMSTLK